MIVVFCIAMFCVVLALFLVAGPHDSDHCPECLAKEQDY